MARSGRGNPILEGGGTKEQRRGHGDRAEKKLAKRTGSRLTPASGAKDGAKGDMTRGELRIESKATLHDSMSIKLEWLLKIRQEALEKNQYPTLAVQFVRENGAAKDGGGWVMIPEYLLDELLGDEE